jgi:hypothetical protein
MINCVIIKLQMFEDVVVTFHDSFKNIVSDISPYLIWGGCFEVVFENVGVFLV